jgi:hypothetical protein
LNLEWSTRRGRDCLVARGWVGDPARSVVLPDGLAAEGAGTPGAFEVEDGTLFFTPRFPFVDGASYVLVVDGERWPLERPSAPGEPTTEVAAIHPAASVVPVNLLKLYLLFSAPMSEGSALRAVSVRTADGEPLEGVFLPMEPELWNSRRTRLTMLLDPGRIKRGLAPHEEAGYPLREGDDVIVSVDAAWRDAEGRRLRAAAERRYRVGPAVREPVDPAAWTIEASARLLRVRFDRPLDRALLEHCLSVPGVAGLGTVGEGDRSWSFAPEAPWLPGRHELAIDTRLEDLAGNSLARVFDRDLTRPEDDPRPGGTATVAFDVTEGGR